MDDVVAVAYSLYALQPTADGATQSATSPRVWFRLERPMWHLESRHTCNDMTQVVSCAIMCRDLKDQLLKFQFGACFLTFSFFIKIRKTLEPEGDATNRRHNQGANVEITRLRHYMRWSWDHTLKVQRLQHYTTAHLQRRMGVVKSSNLPSEGRTLKILNIRSVVISCFHDRLLVVNSILIHRQMCVVICQF